MTKNNNVRGMRLNHINKTIEVSKNFLAKASMPNSAEARELANQMAMYPEYKIEVVATTSTPSKYQALSLEKMLGYVHLYAEADVDTFESYVRVYLNNETGKLQQGKYSIIKKVFTDKYGKAYKKLSTEGYLKIDMKIDELKATEGTYLLNKKVEKGSEAVNEYVVNEEQEVSKVMGF